MFDLGTITTNGLPTTKRLPITKGTGNQCDDKQPWQEKFEVIIWSKNVDLKRPRKAKHPTEGHGELKADISQK